MAKPKKSEFLKAAGKMWALMQLIVNAVLDLGGGDEDLHRLLNDSEMVKKIAELIMSSRQKVGETYKVIVDYGLSLSKMIELGKYGWFNEDINDKHFPLKGAATQAHTIDLVLVHLNRNATTKEVMEYLNNQGLEPAKIEHLLAFGATYPELQKQFPIIALGSSFASVVGNRYCPSLDCGGGERGLDLGWDDDDHLWLETCRFLAFRK